MRSSTGVRYFGKFSLAISLAVSGLTFANSGSRVVAQITPDGTLGIERSIVNNGIINGLPVELIEGGASRGAALFHSFGEFNVGEGQGVYFANPVGIESIFSRVTGNNPSDILGTLGVNGGANLFLLNPNGIIFGQNAQLDIRGSFVASTANSFVFDNGVVFSATNPEVPPLLTLNLTSGLQYGGNNIPQSPLQGGQIITASATRLAVGQDLTLAASNLDLQGELSAGSNLTLFAQDTVRVRDSIINPFIAKAGEKLLIQGNRGVDIFALNHQDSGLFSGGDMVLRSANTVGGDAHYWSGGSFRIEQLDGSLGDLDSPNDPIIRSVGDVRFNNYQGSSLHILAGGSVTIPGIIRIISPQIGQSGVNYIRENVTLSNGTTVPIDGSVRPTLDIRAGVDPNYIGIPALTNRATSGNINLGVAFIQSNIPDGLIFLTNQYQPNPAFPGDLSST
jgi:filamentous hemagglutinin family protein